MPPFLSDPTSTVFVVLIAAAVITGAIFARKQTKQSLAAFAVPLALLLAVFLIDRSSESPREEAVRRATAMGEAANARNPEAFIEHIADTFEYKGGAQPVRKSRNDVRTSQFWSMLRQFNVRVTTWDYNRAEVKESGDAVEIGFMAKGEAEGKPYPLFIRATFKKQADGAMKVTAFATYHPTNHNEPLAIPNFP